MTTVTGKCHVCREIKSTLRYCELCDHFFCDDCRSNIAERVWSFILEKLGGRTPGCCGPA